MKIKVTQEHIERGRPKSDWACPIACALHEQRPTFEVSVGCYKTLINKVMYALPAKARDFIDDFDSGKPVTPFEFELPLEDS